MDAHGLNDRAAYQDAQVPVTCAAQVEAGAMGIDCQKISEVEVFASAGFEDIPITFKYSRCGKT
jgi:D-serine deaminase-like pyridoxal phosphate-dependent protein